MPDSAPQHPDQIRRLMEIVSRLRAPDGCPWDREQTLDSLKQYVIEECYELIDAVESDNIAHHVEELGDVLLQVVLQAQLRSETGHFTFDDVARAVSDKLVHRHPHVFGDTKVTNSGDVLKNWEFIKTTEKKEKRNSILEGLPSQLPALQKAQRVQSRVARVGFDWTRTEDVIAKVEEELMEVKDAIAAGNPKYIEEEIGDLLFATVNLCRFQEIQAEEALRHTIAKFTRRFQAVEARVKAEQRDLKSCTIEELEAHWQAVKATERATPSD